MQSNISADPSLASPATKTDPAFRKGPMSKAKKVWIDLENSPHVPFFRPIIEQLEKRGYEVAVTARDCFQVCELAELFNLKHQRVGRHYGKHTLAKLAGLGVRMFQLSPYVLREKPDLAVCHGSRSLFVLASLLGIPTLNIMDYEHAHWVSFPRPTWIMAPDIIPEDKLWARGVPKSHVLRYPGIKEDVYAPSFHPDPSLKERLGLDERDLVVTLRPPATDAHYHNPESDKLLYAVFEFLGRHDDVKIVFLPRTPKQESSARRDWPGLFQRKQVIVPEHVINGLDMVWFSDVVISGGGTMNREAAALGVPVYSIFRGKTGSVDKYLSDTGRLILLETPDDVKTKLQLCRRDSAGQPVRRNQVTLNTVVDNIVMAVEYR